MNESAALHKKADRLYELADTLRETTEEICKVLFDQAKTVRFNARLQFHSEQRKEDAGREEGRHE